MKPKTTVGIWGYSTVGASAARYFVNQGIRPGIFDANPLSDEQQDSCRAHHLQVWDPSELTAFLDYYDTILPSPGIDLRPYTSYQHKWISEFDIFCQNYAGSLVAITGSIGKTSITHLLSELLRKSGSPVATGGNIGIGMLDLLTPDAAQTAVLELSSFQLDLVKTGNPDLAIITNIYPNHLDRHGTLDAYMRAKSHMYRAQQAHQKLLIPHDLVTDFCALHTPASQLYTFCESRPAKLPERCVGVFFLNGMDLIYATYTKETTLISLSTLPPLTFIQNWLVIASAAHLLGVDLQTLLVHASTFALPAHRMEYVARANEVTFYNDSKGTTAVSMLAAVKTVAHRKNVHLFIGGLSKGVDREPAIAQLPDHLVHAYCFGAEAAQIHALCARYGIASSTHATLDDAFSLCTTQIHKGDAVLLSPGGASYDLFKDYEHRGRHFIDLVKEYLICYPTDHNVIEKGTL